MRGYLPRRGGRVFALAGTGAAALTIAAAGGANPSPADVAQLRAHANSLAARSHRALLDLYAADTQLASANTRLATLRRQVSQVREQRELIAHAVAVATRAQRISLRRLAAHVTALYEQGQPDPLATILGSSSLDEAVTNIDAMNRVANQDRRVARTAAAARERLSQLSRQLAARTTALETAEQQAAASVVALERARSHHSALLASLRSQQQLTRGRIATLDARARAAQARTQELAAAVASGDPEPAAAAAPPPAAAPVASADTAAVSAGAQTLTVVATGYALPGRTATGLPVGWGIAAVDPSVIPLGTHMAVPGYGDAVAADVGNGVRGAMIDLWFPTLAQARAWGRRTVTISLH